MSTIKFLKWLCILLLILIAVYFLDPKPSPRKYDSQLPAVQSQPSELEQFIYNREAVHKLKPGNEARIVWANDSAKNLTSYAVVYLHGFSASHEEGNPLHREFAKTFGCNLYLGRLDDHGIDTSEALLHFTAEGWWKSAKEAYAIGKKIGKKVILMATSAGGTVALKLAAEYPDIAGLILLSPNIAINDSNAWVLNDPWGLQITRMIKGTYNTASDTTARYAQYWNSKYRMEATVQLEELIETTMLKSVFEKVNNLHWCFTIIKMKPSKTKW